MSNERTTRDDGQADTSLDPIGGWEGRADSNVSYFLRSLDQNPKQRVVIVAAFSFQTTFDQLHALILPPIQAIQIPSR
jgi:hypothetical protein